MGLKFKYLDEAKKAAAKKAETSRNGTLKAKPPARPAPASRQRSFEHLAAISPGQWEAAMRACV